MSGKPYFRLILAVCLLIITSASVGQEEQRLQYQSSRNAQSILQGLSNQRLKLISEKPEGVTLPDFKKEKPLFYKWQSPMTKNGYLLIAADCNQIDGAHDLLYIDSNGDGNLKDEKAIDAYRAERQHSYFGPVKVTLREKTALSRII